MLSPHRNRSLHCDEGVIAPGRSRRAEEPTGPQCDYRDDYYRLESHCGEGAIAPRQELQLLC